MRTLAVFLLFCGSLSIGQAVSFDASSYLLDMNFGSEDISSSNYVAEPMISYEPDASAEPSAPPSTDFGICDGETGTYQPIYLYAEPEPTPSTLYAEPEPTPSTSPEATAEGQLPSSSPDETVGQLPPTTEEFYGPAFSGDEQVGTIGSAGFVEGGSTEGGSSDGHVAAVEGPDSGATGDNSGGSSGGGDTGGGSTGGEAGDAISPTGGGSDFESADFCGPDPLPGSCGGDDFVDGTDIRRIHPDTANALIKQGTHLEGGANGSADAIELPDGTPAVAKRFRYYNATQRDGLLKSIAQWKADKSYVPILAVADEGGTCGEIIIFMQDLRSCRDASKMIAACGGAKDLQNCGFLPQSTRDELAHKFLAALVKHPDHHLGNVMFQVQWDGKKYVVNVYMIDPPTLGATPADPSLVVKRLTRTCDLPAHYDPKFQTEYVCKQLGIPEFKAHPSCQMVEASGYAPQPLVRNQSNGTVIVSKDDPFYELKKVIVPKGELPENVFKVCKPTAKLQSIGGKPVVSPGLTGALEIVGYAGVAADLYCMPFQINNQATDYIENEAGTATGPALDPLVGAGTGAYVDATCEAIIDRAMGACTAGVIGLPRPDQPTDTSVESQNFPGVEYCYNAQGRWTFDVYKPGEAAANLGYGIADSCIEFGKGMQEATEFYAEQFREKCLIPLETATGVNLTAPVTKPPVCAPVEKFIPGIGKVLSYDCRR